MYTDLRNYAEQALKSSRDIPEERKKELDKVSRYITEKRKNHEPVNLLYVCTHNSRRSQFSQVWATIAAHYFGIHDVQAHSGGTEITYFHDSAIETLKRAGCRITKGSGNHNPPYRVLYSDTGKILECYSKKFNHKHLPKKNFAAILTCSDAEKLCPVVPGAELRIAIPYEDPKKGDGTSQQNQLYADCCRQVANEIFYTFSQLEPDAPKN
jgi:protein-tyrosine-phosphatase